MSIPAARQVAEARKRLLGLFGRDRGLYAGMAMLGLQPGRVEESEARYALAIAEAHRDGLAGATLFVADEAMVALIDAAGPTMPDQPLRETDVPTGDGPGLVWFAEPLPDRSGEAPVVPLQALGWQTLPDGNPVLRGKSGISVLLTAYVRADALAAAEGHDVAPGTPGLLPFSTVVWERDTLIGTAFGEVPDVEGVTPGFFQRAAAAFWALMAQPRITDVRDDKPLHPTERRNHRRAGVTDPGAPVHVITVAGRGPEPTSIPGSDTGRRLTHRHVVRGHWRRQWHPSLQEHRHIWIDSHVKGPADAPLLGGERVFVTRGSDRT